MSSPERAKPADVLFPGDGEMARRMRAYPWRQSALGDPAGWPASLRTACRICLTSRFPMIVWWGEQLRFFYNDAYLPLLGTKHPALAKPGEAVWTEIWDIIGPMLTSVMASGEATWSEDLLLPMNRHGYWEETYWTYSYSPLHDDEGTVRGVFTAVSDTTERVIGERRLAALQDLGALAGRARSATEACHLVTRALGRAAADIPFAAIYLRRPGTDETILAASSPPEEMPVPAVSGPGGWPVTGVLRSGQPATLSDVAARFAALPAGGWQTSPAQAMVLPLPGETGGQTVGVIVLAASAGRTLDDAYASFLGLVAQQAAALINAAVAYQFQQRRAEELAELDRAKTAFFSNISHEFRTPLTLIMGPLEELRTRLVPGDQAARQELDVIHRNGLRLGKLVNTLLDFSRIEAGRMQARYEPVDLAPFTADLASVFRSAIERAGLSYEVHCTVLPEPVYVDREMWEKVVLNLLSNALKFTFDGAISVTLGEQNGQATLRIADTGIGVAADEMPRLFERFHRIPSARSRSNEGSGIGLALVRELVGLHGGTITADSTEGAGTTFTVRLPFGHDHLPAANVAPAAGPDLVSAAADPFVEEVLRWLPDGEAPLEALPPAAGARLRETWGPPGLAGLTGPTGPARVLLADDNADMREYLRRLLRASYQVTAVADGLTALDAVRVSPPDLVISDVMMPGLDGLALVAALRSDPRTADVPVLLLSARAGEEAAIEGLEAGADDYLVKPFSAAELLARVRANVELARLRNHHARWRAALIDSLHEAFFLCDEAGAVVEINAAFTDMLGYGPEGLPYKAEYAWWPAEDTEPEAHRQVGDAFGQLMRQSKGSFVAPATHKDGHRLWVAASFNEVRDPDTGRRMVVGTLRDITAEHYAGQREAALAAMGLLLSQASSVPQALQGAINELQRLWQVRRVLAVTWDGSEQPSVMSTGAEASWPDLPAPLRERISALRRQPPLSPDGGSGTGAPGDAAARDGRTGAVGITVEHPRGLLALWMDLDAARAFSAEDRALLALLCGYLGQALHRVHQTDQQRETALALQRAILGPARLPEGFAARYEPANRPLEVGGDWYDIVELPDGRIGIVVGDCVGHGLDAATVMGQLRSACRALLLQDSSAAQTLTAMDRFAALIPGAICSTVFCGILDRETGRLTYSSAGHPPGILALPDGRTELLEDGRSFPLAVQPGIERTEASRIVPARAALLLYTDGLVERRRRSMDTGIAEAGAAVHRGDSAAVEDLATAIMTAMTPDGGYEDDVALVLYRHPAPLEVTFPAESAQLAPVRATLRTWLSRCDLSQKMVQDVLVAAGEACANAVEHGHRNAPGEQIQLRAAATVTQLRLTITDTGRWKVARSANGTNRGHGIPLMRALMQQVTIEPGDAGTTVDMQLRITP
ncbi:MAG: SpoIIE family protein phosphatase [Streptosporangiaceae bacterium]|jgi:PAS domain S-box-containing protein